MKWTILTWSIFLDDSTNAVQMWNGEWIACSWSTPATIMMTSSDGIIFRVTGPLCGPLWRRALVFPLFCAWINGWANNREIDNLRCRRAYYEVIVMYRVPHHWHAPSKRTPCGAMGFNSTKCLYCPSVYHSASWLYIALREIATIGIFY